MLVKGIMLKSRASVPYFLLSSIWTAPVLRHLNTTGQTFICERALVIAFTLYGPRKSIAVEVKGGQPMKSLSWGSSPSCWLSRTLYLLWHSRQLAAISLANGLAWTIQASWRECKQVSFWDMWVTLWLFIMRSFGSSQVGGNTGNLSFPRICLSC